MTILIGQETESFEHFNELLKILRNSILRGVAENEQMNWSDIFGSERFYCGTVRKLRGEIMLFRSVMFI